MDSCRRLWPGARMRPVGRLLLVAVVLAAFPSHLAAQTATPETAAGSQPAVSIATDVPRAEAKPGDAAPAAEAAPSGDVGWLRVTGNSVNVRARPDLNSLAVTKVSRDALLQSVGKEFGWYAIKPPAEVFSLVAARYRDETTGRDVSLIERQGNVGVVRVEEGTTLRVRAGSRVVEVDPQQSEVQTRLKSGDRVEIIGERGEWLMITPPADVKVYISAEFVARISDSEAASLRAGGAPPATAARPAAGWAAQLKPLEDAVHAESQKPVADQAWQPLLDALRPIMDQRDDPLVAGSANRLFAVASDRARAQESIRAGAGVVKQDSGEPARSAADQPTTAPGPTAEPQSSVTGPERSIVIAPAPIAPERVGFDAEGELQPTFAVPAGKDGLRFRLIDPATRATRAYVEFPWQMSFRPTEHIGRYVGIQGERTVDVQKEVTIWRVSRATVLTPDRPVVRPRTNP